MEMLSPNLFLFRDTCHVYIIRSGDEAVFVDFGDGAALAELSTIGVQRVTDILITHHHRDQVQGLARMLASDLSCMVGVRIWGPHAEQDLFHSVDLHWQARSLLTNYDVRQDRFSLLEITPLVGTLQDYRDYPFGGRTWTVLPTPGHTPGSLTLLVEIDGQRAAFTGDLIAGPGKVWSMAALQWSYQLMDGAAASIPALVDLKQHGPDMLLPSHGEIMMDPPRAVDLLIKRLSALLAARHENQRLFDWLREPYEVITPHLLRNRTSVSNSYVLLSTSGKALLIDYGYDFRTSNATGPDRAWHRPWLYTLPALKRDFGVQKIEVAVTTHYHDDHVAGLNLLREVMGTQIWAAENFASILEHPQDNDLPCLWHESILVDRVMPLGEPLEWEEYSLTAYPLSGHTRYAAAIAFCVDGKQVLATGDQYKDKDGLGWNYVYQNRFAFDDYIASAALYAWLAPDLILPGHWEPLWVTRITCAALPNKASYWPHCTGICSPWIRWILAAKALRPESSPTIGWGSLAAGLCIRSRCIIRCVMR